MWAHIKMPEDDYRGIFGINTIWKKMKKCKATDVAGNHGRGKK